MHASNLHHPNSEFASLTPGAYAKAADARPSLLPASAATDHHKYGSADSRSVGRAPFGGYRHIHACGHDWSAFRVRAGFIASHGSPHLAVRHSTTRAGRPIGSVGSRRTNFRASQGCRPADRNSSSDNLFRHIAEHLSHSSKSSISVADQPSDGAGNEVPEIRVFGTPDDR